MSLLILCFGREFIYSLVLVSIFKFVFYIYWFYLKVFFKGKDDLIVWLLVLFNGVEIVSIGYEKFLFNVV